MCSSGKAQPRLARSEPGSQRTLSSWCLRPSLWFQNLHSPLGSIGLGFALGPCAGQRHKSQASGISDGHPTPPGLTAPHPHRTSGREVAHKLANSKAPSHTSLMGHPHHGTRAALFLLLSLSFLGPAYLLKYILREYFISLL